VVICNPDDEYVAQFAYKRLEVPETVDCLQGILNVIPLQLLSFHIATKKNLDVSVISCCLVIFYCIQTSHQFQCFRMVLV